MYRGTLPEFPRAGTEAAADCPRAEAESHERGSSVASMLPMVREAQLTR